MSITSAILLIGVITILYDIIGGIGIVIQSDVLQMGIVILGLVIVGGSAWSMVGWSEAWSAWTPGAFKSSTSGVSAFPAGVNTASGPC